MSSGEYELIRRAFYYTQSIDEVAQKGLSYKLRFLVKNGELTQQQLNVALREVAGKWVASRGHLEVVQCLVEAGADIHDLGGWPLRWAASRGYLDVVQYLVGKGANVQDKLTLSLAIQNGHLEVVQCLATQNGHLEVVPFIQQCLLGNTS